jgi:hypothetical protein
MHFKDMLYQSTPRVGAGTKSPEDVAQLLQEPGRLLTTKLRGDPPSTTLCVYTGASKAFAGYNFDRVANRDCQMIFGVSPTHTMYHAAETNDAKHALGIQAEAGNLSLGSGPLKLEFTNGLQRLIFTMGLTTTESDVEGLEVWTM